MTQVMVYVGLDEFDDDEILDCAVSIVRRALEKANPPGDLLQQIEALRAALREPDERGPSSTAARLKDFGELKALVEGGTLYRFAESRGAATA